MSAGDLPPAGRCQGGYVGHAGYAGHVGQGGHAGHVGQGGQGGHVDRVGQGGHVGQGSHVGLAGHAGPSARPGSIGGAAAVMISACHAMAERFHRGGKLLVLGSAGCAADAARITVDFLRPIGVGRRGLPAVAFGPDATRCLSRLRRLAEPGDIVLAVAPNGCCPDVAAALGLARARGLVTVALVGGDGGDVAADALADHVLVARSGDPAVVKDLHGTMYHALWELVHVLLEQPGLFDPAVLS